MLFVLDESGRAVREVVRHESLGEDSLQMSGMTHSDFTLDSQSKDRIQGAIRTKGSEQFLKHKYQTDLRFNASIRQAKRDEPLPDGRSGQKLPAGGGEPGKAYFAFQDAVRRKDLAAIRKLKPADVPDMPDDDLKKALELMAAMSPTKVTITEAYINGDTAALYLTGFQGGEKQYGTVRMNKSGGVWRATQEKWSNTPPGK